MEIEQGDLRRLAVLLLVFSIQPRIADRTQIQKMAYIVNECGWHAISDYKFIARGPFSKWLDSQLDAWVAEGIVEEAEESILIGTDNEVGFYCYSLTTKGKSLAENIFHSINEPELVNSTVENLSKLSKYTEQELEITSSILYVCEEEGLDRDSIVRKMLRFRPEFTEKQIREHLDILEHVKHNIAS